MEKPHDDLSLFVDRGSRGEGSEALVGPIHADALATIRLDMDSGALSIYRGGTETAEDALVRCGRVGADNREQVLRVCWQFWREAGMQSQARYRGAPNVIDL